MGTFIFAIINKDNNFVIYGQILVIFHCYIVGGTVKQVKDNLPSCPAFSAAHFSRVSSTASKRLWNVGAGLWQIESLSSSEPEASWLSIDPCPNFFVLWETRPKIFIQKCEIWGWKPLF